MKKIKKLLASIEQQSLRKKILIYLSLFALMIVYFFFLSYVVGMFYKSLFFLIDKTEHSTLWYGLSFSTGKITTLILYGLTFAMIFIGFFIVNKRNDIESIDERGVSYLSDGISGTAHWINDRERDKFYSVGTPEQTNEMIFGTIGKNTSKTVSYKEVIPPGSKHTLVLGSSGTGKSFSFVRTELLQIAKRAESFAVNDPAGELFEDTSDYFKNLGYDVKILNVKEPEYSDCWNCLNEVISPKTERLDDSRLAYFVISFMRNANVDDAKEEKFWFDAASNILTATIGYYSYLRESAIVDRYQELYSRIIGIRKDNENPVIRYMNVKSFPWCRQMIIEEAKKRNINLDKITKIFDEIMETAPKFNISMVYDGIMSFNTIEEGFKLIPNGHPGKEAYRRFNSSLAPQVRGQAIQGAQMKVEILSNRKYRYLLSHDGINLHTFNKKKTALYIISSDTSPASNVVSSLSFSFLLKDAQEVADIEEMTAKKEKRQSNIVKSNVILDEFSSLGVIGGDPTNFRSVMEVIRKRKVRISIICQNITQMDKNYGEEIALTIRSNCENIIFIGTNDEKTAKFISDFSGQATVLNERHAETGGLIEGGGTQIDASAVQRPLLTLGEALRFKGNVLVMRLGAEPMKLQHFKWVDHPAYKKGYVKKKSIYEIMPSLEDEMDSMMYNDDDLNTNNIDEMIQELLNNMSSNENISYDDNVLKENNYSNEKTPRNENANNEPAKNSEINLSGAVKNEFNDIFSKFKDSKNDTENEIEDDEFGEIITENLDEILGARNFK